MNEYEKRAMREVANRAYNDKHADRQRKDKIYSEYREYAWYCVSCRKDFTGIGARIDGVYRIRHECGKECIRNNADDEYYNLSEIIRVQRQTYEDDMLSPYQNRFRVLYEDTADIDREELNETLIESAYRNHRIEGAPSSIPKALREELISIVRE